MVCPAGSHGLYCGKTGKVGAYDIRQRYSPGRRGDDKENWNKPGGGCFPLNSWEASFLFWRDCLLEEKALPYRSEHDREGGIEDPGPWKDRGKISPYLRGKRRIGGSFSCPSGRGDVFSGRDT